MILRQFFVSVFILNVGIIFAQVPILLKEINPSQGSYVGVTADNFVHEGKYYFLANDGVHGNELWVSDGTAGNTTLLKDIVVGAEGVKSARMAALGSSVIISVNSVNNSSIWKTDGTEAGTVLIKTIQNNSGYSPGSETIASAGGYVYFDANDGINGPELWRTDGTETGTMMIKNAGSSTSKPDAITAWGNIVLYYYDDNNHDFELWRSDGTAAGTVIVKDINPTWFSNFSQKRIVPTPIGAFFIADDGTNGKELWISDGSEAGTRMVKNINPGSEAGAVLYKNDPSTSNYAFFNGKFYFNGDDQTNGLELWSTDGTSAGTNMVKNAVPGSGILNIFQMKVLNDKLIFLAETTDQGYELWISDGTASGTGLLKEIGVSFVDGANPFTNLALYANRIWFGGKGQGAGTELWKTDGTAAGTIQVADILPGFGSSTPKQLTVLGDKLIFFADKTGSNDDEPFVLFDPSVSTKNLIRASETLEVAPNPISNYFTISTDASLEKGQLLKLFSLQGQLIKTWSILDNYQTFDCSTLPPGTYLLYLLGQNGQGSGAKIVIN